MIVTLTANPSVDRTVQVEALVRGAVIRALAARVDPGGKGVNISRALAANGCETCAVLPSGGTEGAQLAALMAGESVNVVLVPIAGAVRANVSVAEPDGTVTKINEPGPVLTAGELEAVAVATLEAARGAAWVAVSGSLPPGAGDDFYARLIDRLRFAGNRVALDTSGVAFQLALTAGPDVAKPNAEELAEATGRKITTVGDAVEAAERLREKGAVAVLASLGSDGAILVDASGATHGEAPVAHPRSAVGAGDALLAGFLAAGGEGPAALAEALAWGAAATGLPGSRMPRPAEINIGAVELHDVIDHTRILKGS